MAGKRASLPSQSKIETERPKTTTSAREGDPTNCDNCGKPLGVWFSLNDKAYCSPCFHAKFWTPFQSVPAKAK